MAQDSIHVLITFALDDELVEQVRAVDPERIDVTLLGAEQRRALRGLYPSESERANVAQGLSDAFESAEVVFGFWGTELHYALIDARAMGGHVPAKTLAEAAPKLRWIQLTSAGADRLLGSGFVESGITVTTVSGLHATPIGEYVIGAMLQWAKGVPRTMRAQLRHEWVRFAPTELSGKTVGVVGLGHIGGEVARLAKAFGCRVIANRRSAEASVYATHIDELLPAADLHSLLAQSDYVAVCVPLTPETRGLIGERELRAMKPSACIVNIARGPVIDEQALIAALRDGTIAGAALDVFEQEPLPEDSPLWDMENVLITPHISGGTEIYSKRATEIFVRNLRHYLAGEPLENVVDPARGY
jgi:phosphoglycerate dehydrogenase-like enzyme